MVDNYDEQLATLFGPAAKYSDHQRGETIQFKDGNQVLQGVIDWVAATGEVVEGGRHHPVRYIVAVDGVEWPFTVYPGEIVE